MGDLGERQRLLFREDVEDRLERAVSPGAMQPQLVAEAEPARERAAGREETRECADGIHGTAAHPGQALADGAEVHGAAVGERLHGATNARSASNASRVFEGA